MLGMVEWRMGNFMRGCCCTCGKVASSLNDNEWRTIEFCPEHLKAIEEQFGPMTQYINIAGLILACDYKELQPVLLAHNDGNSISILGFIDGHIDIDFF